MHISQRLLLNFLPISVHPLGDFGGSANLSGTFSDRSDLWTQTGASLEAAFGYAWLGEDEGRRVDDAE